MPLHRILAIVGVLFVGSAPAFAQPALTSVQNTSPSPELDLRLGALWPEDGAQWRAAVGGRLALRPWMSILSGRLSAQFTGDFRSFGGQNGWDDIFQLHRRITRNRLVLGAAVGFDLVRTEHTALEIRAGGALVRTRTNFLIDSSMGFVVDANVWENVCPFEGFKARCSTDYEGAALAGVGLRHDLVRSGATYLGVDYTALGIGQHILVGTVGMRLR